MVADLANSDVTKTHKNVRFGVRHAEKKSPDLLQSGETYEYIVRVPRRCYRRADDRGDFGQDASIIRPAGSTSRLKRLRRAGCCRSLKSIDLVDPEADGAIIGRRPHIVTASRRNMPPHIE